MLVYDTTLQTAKGKGFHDKTSKKLSELIEIIRELAKDKYTSLYELDVIQDFLNTDFSEDYKKTLTDISNELNVINSNKVREFMKGNIGSYRHLNGAALKLAALSRLEDLIYNKVDINELITIAGEKKEKLQEINSHNFTNLKKSVGDKFRIRILANTFSSFDEIKKRFIWAIKDYQKGDYVLDEITAESLNNKYTQNKRSKADILNRLCSNIERTNDAMKTLGIMIYDKEGIKRFIKNDTTDLNKILEETKEARQETLNSGE
jgi:hypothetical protein